MSFFVFCVLFCFSKNGNSNLDTVRGVGYFLLMRPSSSGVRPIGVINVLQNHKVWSRCVVSLPVCYIIVFLLRISKCSDSLPAFIYIKHRRIEIYKCPYLLLTFINYNANASS